MSKNAGSAEKIITDLPLIMIPKIDLSPTMDGKLDDEAWKSAVKVTGYVDISGYQLVKNQTESYLCYDNNNLYIGVKCWEANITKIRREQKKNDCGMVWSDDCVEIFFDINLKQKEYYQIVINSLGTIDDYLWNGNGQLNGHYERGTYVGENYWSVEIAVPFAELGVATPAKGTMWGLGLCREEQVDPINPELSSWNPTYGTFHRPDRFGYLTFGGKTPVVQVNSIGDLSIGDNEGNLVLTNLTDNVANLKIQSFVMPSAGENIVQTQNIRLKPKEKKELAVPYFVKKRRDCKLLFKVSDIKSGKNYYQTIQYPIRIEAVEDTIEAMEKKLQGLGEQIKKEKKYQNEELTLSSFRNRLRDIKKGVTKAGKIERSEWSKLAKEVDELKPEFYFFTNRFESALLQKKKFDNTEWGIGIEGPTQKVFKDAPFAGKITNNNLVKTAKNEYCSFQLILTSFTNDLQKIQIEAGDLLGPKKGMKIPSENIKIYRAGYVRTTSSSTLDVKRTGWWPDPLLELEKTGFGVQKGEIQPIWLTIYVPADAPEGKYSTEITIKPSNSYNLSLKLDLHVWDFSLPVPHRLSVYLQILPQPLAEEYGYNTAFMSDRSISPPAGYKNILEKYREILAEHGNNVWELGVGESPKFTIEKDGEIRAGFGDVDQFLEKYSKRGALRQFFIGYRLGGGSAGFDYFTENESFFDSNFETFKSLGVQPISKKENKERLGTILSLYNKYLKNKKWEGKALWYVYDEPGIPEEFALLNEGAELGKEVAPDIKCLAVVSNLTNISKKLDVVVVGVYGASPGILQTINSGKGRPEYWFYICNSPYHPYPNFTLDYPAVDYRIRFWMDWKYKVKGFLYYAVNHWSAGGPWKEGATVESYISTGMGVLLYPGKQGPINTIRLEGIRDGIQDYDYLCLLSEYLEKLKQTRDNRQFKGKEADKLVAQGEKLLYKINSEVIKGLTEYTQDPQVIYDVRMEMGELIEAMRKLIPHSFSTAP